MNDPLRRQQLNSLKLHALVREHFGVRVPVAADQPNGFGAGAAWCVDGVAWVLLDEQPERGLGPALAWAVRSAATRLHVLAERGTGQLARRAAGFTFSITVWRVGGRTLEPAVPELLAASPPLAAEHQQFSAVISAAGAAPVVEHGVLAGEVLGLEVCRVVADPDSGEVRLEVGIGAHDREVFQMLHGNRPTPEALADVVRSVAARRSPGSPRHPFNLLARERMLRSLLVDQPGLLGAQSVVVAPPPLPRPNLKDPVPCVAVASIAAGQVAVVCSSGVDLDLVPFAVDACDALGLDECIIVVPSRDALPIQRRIASMARATITMVGVDAVA
ncbi:MAG: hypothetical protein WCK21_08450 [Actinomycetota bacterium]